jgi:POTRA domain, FtsQ-type
MSEPRDRRRLDAMPRARLIRFPRRSTASDEQVRRPRVSPPGRIGVDLHGGFVPPPQPLQPAAPRAPSPSRPGSGVAPITSPPATQLPSRPRARRRRLHPTLIFLACAQVALIAGALWALLAPTWQVRHVRVAGTSDPVLLAAIARLHLGGCDIFRCDLAPMAHQVESLPLVAHADVHADLPDGLIVVVSPRRPAVLWQIGTGTYVLADDGVVLGTPQSDPALLAAPLPQTSDAGAVAFGGMPPAAGARLAPTLVKMAGQLRMGMAGVLASDWVLEYTAASGFVATDSTGRQVIFGTPRDAASTVAGPGTLQQLADPAPDAVTRGVRMQLAELSAILVLLRKNGQSAALIDLRWGTNPYYRLAS